MLCAQNAVFFLHFFLSKAMSQGVILGSFRFLFISYGLPIFQVGAQNLIWEAGLKHPIAGRFHDGDAKWAAVMKSKSSRTLITSGYKKVFVLQNVHWGTLMQFLGTLNLASWWNLKMNLNLNLDVKYSRVNAILCAWGRCRYSSFVWCLGSHCLQKQQQEGQKNVNVSNVGGLIYRSCVYAFMWVYNVASTPFRLLNEFCHPYFTNGLTTN